MYLLLFATYKYLVRWVSIWFSFFQFIWSSKQLEYQQSSALLWHSYVTLIFIFDRNERSISALLIFFLLFFFFVLLIRNDWIFFCTFPWYLFFAMTFTKTLTNYSIFNYLIQSLKRILADEKQDDMMDMQNLHWIRSFKINLVALLMERRMLQRFSTLFFQYKSRIYITNGQR